MIGLSENPDTMWSRGRFWEAKTVADFWSKLNPPVHYACLVVFRWIRRKTGTRVVVLPTILAIFVFTGLWHDGFVWLANLGKESFQYYFTIFFLMNGVVVVVERFSRARVPLPTITKKLLTFGWLVGSFWLASTIDNLLH